MHSSNCLLFGCKECTSYVILYHTLRLNIRQAGDKQSVASGLHLLRWFWFQFLVSFQSPFHTPFRWFHFLVSFSVRSCFVCSLSTGFSKMFRMENKMFRVVVRTNLFVQNLMPLLLWMGFNFCVSPYLFPSILLGLNCATTTTKHGYAFFFVMCVTVFWYQLQLPVFQIGLPILYACFWVGENWFFRHPLRLKLVMGVVEVAENGWTNGEGQKRSTKWERYKWKSWKKLEQFPLHTLL
jgi:hypothetical protein